MAAFFNDRKTKNPRISQISCQKTILTIIVNNNSYLCAP